MKVSTANKLGIALLLIGSTAMIGDILGCFPVKGIGAITCIAPFPKVFSEMDGVEGFAAEFNLRIQQTDGRSCEIAINPELYSQMKGPYNRRNVYGAALAGGPFLPEKLWKPVFRHGLNEGGPLREEFQIPRNTESIEVHIKTKTRGRDDKWTFAP